MGILFSCAIVWTSVCVLERGGGAEKSKGEMTVTGVLLLTLFIFASDIPRQGSSCYCLLTTCVALVWRYSHSSSFVCLGCAAVVATEAATCVLVASLAPLKHERDGGWRLGMSPVKQTTARSDCMHRRAGRGHLPIIDLCAVITAALRTLSWSRCEMSTTVALRELGTRDVLVIVAISGDNPIINFLET